MDARKAAQGWWERLPVDPGTGMKIYNPEGVPVQSVEELLKQPLPAQPCTQSTEEPPIPLAEETPEA